MKKVIVLGSGIQGMCCAFALYDNGYDVTLVEKDKQIFNRTSKNQEGRLHMGFTYALDRSGKTSEAVLMAALNFSSILEEWFGKVDWNKLLLAKGYYLIHKDQSLLSESEIINHYQKLYEFYQNQLQENKQLTYFGNRPKKLFEVLDKIPVSISEKRVSRVIKTQERTLEMIYFRELMIQNLAKRKIKVLTQTEAKNAERTGNGFRVQVFTENKLQNLNADIVVNCLWNNRVEFDKTLGITTIKDPLYRFKVGLFGSVDKPVPNCSIISGAFGNISPRLSGNHAYISWHPDCMLDMTTEGITPAKWEESFLKPETIHSEWVNSAIQNLSEFIPSLATFKVEQLLPGVICSAGKTDIGDINSNVHKRGEHMGVHAFDNYYSIDTGKFSTAPLFAKELIRLLKEA